MDEPQAKALLAAHGIAVPRGLVLAPDAVPDLTGLRPPFALKVIAPSLSHKSDAGGVALRLADAAAVLAARDAMLGRPAIRAAQPSGFLLEEMAPPGHELVIGATRDPKFGPVVMLGLGGIFVEIFQDVAFRLCPLRRHEARDMLAELRALPVLRGARGGVVADEAAIIETVLAVDRLLMQRPDIAELDINPLIVGPHGAVAVDARIVEAAP